MFYILVIVNWGGDIISRSRYVPPDEMDCVLMALTPANRLVARVCLRTGLRVSDVLSLRTDDIRRAADGKQITVHEQKTGKTRRISLPVALCDDILSVAGTVYAFPHARDPGRHRTRQAVYTDIHRAARALRLKPVSPHSMRKCYAVRKYHATGSIDAVRRALQHDNDAVTLLYALADQLPRR